MTQVSMSRWAVAAAVALITTSAVADTAGARGHAAKPRRTEALTVTNRATELVAGTNVGTSDGHIGGRAVHGALRAQVTGGQAFTASGWLLYPAGALRYVLHGQLTPAPNGGRYDSGSGTITGGSGAFAGAHGKLQAARVLIPAGSKTFTYTLRGKLTLP